MNRRLPLLLAAFALILSAGLVHGLWTNRWVPSDEPGASAARLQRLPRTVNDWDGEDREIPATQLAIGEIAGYQSRQYVNRLTGSKVEIMIVCGRPGPISVHTPEVCFGGAGYQMVGSETRVSVLPQGGAGGPSEFRSARMKKTNTPVPDTIRILWAWSSDGVAWQAPDYPRLAFAGPGHDALYKLYVIRHVAQSEEAPEDDACIEFVQPLLRELASCLAPGS
jgi:hypothetical protein